MSYLVDWRKLNPNSFEELCQHILLDRLGSKLRPFAPGGADGGRDAEYNGFWKDEEKEGYFIFEMKFHDPDRYSHEHQGARKIQRDLKQMLERSTRLQADHCYLLTNVECTTGCRSKCDQLVKAYLDLDDNRKCLKTYEIWDGSKLTSFLYNSPHLIAEHFYHVIVLHVSREDAQIDGLTEIETTPPLNISLDELSARQDHIGVISALLQDRKYLKVIEEFAKVHKSGIERLPRKDQINILTIQAAALRSLERHEEALLAIKEVYDLEEHSVQCTANLILCLNEVGQKHEAQSYVIQGLHNWPQNSYISIAAAVVNAGDLKLDEAMQQIDRAIELEPTLPIAWYVRACFKARRGQHLQAMTDCENALQMEPDNPVFLNHMGVLYMKTQPEEEGSRQKSIQQALSHLERAAVMSKSIYNTKYGKSIRLNFAIVAFLDEQTSRAISLLIDLKNDQGIDHIVWACLGECYLVSRKWKEAEKAYNEAQKRGINDSAIRNNLAVAIMNTRSNRFRAALRMLRTIRDDESAVSAAYVNIAQCLLQLGEYDAALSSLDRALVLGARDWKLNFIRAEIFAALNQIEGAISEAIICIDTASHEIAVHNLLLNLLVNHLQKTSGNVIVGLKKYLKPLNADPRQCDAFLNRISVVLNEYKAAVTQMLKERGRSLKYQTSFACIDCWKITIKLVRLLQSIEEQMATYESPETQKRLTDYILTLIASEQTFAHKSLPWQNTLDERDMYEHTYVLKASDRKNVTVRFLTAQDYDTDHFCSILKTHGTSGNWDSGLRLRLQAGFSTLAQGIDELKSVANSNRRISTYHHQISAVLRVLRQCEGQAVLADEVGLGKTIEAGLVIKEYQIRGMIEDALVIVPPTLIEQWRLEMKDKFGLHFKVWSKRWDSKKWESEQLVIASIHSLKRPEYSDIIDSRVWDILVVDEAHHARRPASQAWTLINRLRTRYRLLLTATPIHNSMRDLYAIVNLTKPGTFHSYSAFKNDFVDEKDSSDRTAKNISTLRRLLSTVLIRTRRIDTTMELPARQVFTQSIELSTAEHVAYQEVTQYIRQCLKKQDDGRRDLSLYTLQRELCSSPSAAANTLLVIAKRRTNNSYRRRRLREMAKRCLGLPTPAKWHAVEVLIHNCKNEKIIIYTEFRRTAESLTQFLKEKRLNAILLCGKSEKTSVIEDFRNTAQILVATEVGTEGLNLQFCRNVVNLDFPWNPMRIEQRIGRVHRIDQMQVVRVFNLVTQNTIEDYIVEVLEKKLRLFQLLVGEAESVLGMMSDRKSFEAEIYTILANAKDEQEIRRELQRYGEQIAGAVAEFEIMKHIPDSLVIPLSATEMGEKDIENA